MVLLAKRLKEGAHIAVVSPSSYADDEWINAGRDALIARGYKVTVHGQCSARNGCFAGTVDEKVAALHEVFADKNVDAVFCARGGNGAIHILDSLDFELIKNNPKIFMGYSDITALHAAIHKNTGLITFHGPTCTEFGWSGYDDYSRSSSLNLLSGHKVEAVYEGVQVNQEFDKISGKIIVGNLCLLTALLGTKHQPSFKHTILMIEEIGEEASHIDRMLWNWRSAGYLDNVKALVVGRFSDVKDTGDVPFGFTVNQIIERHTAGLDIPIVTGVSFGHKGRNPAIPYGINATMKVVDSTLTLTFDGQVVE